MKIENEVTGEISERLNNIIRVDIYLRGEKIDNFEIYLNSESISLYLEHNTDKFLGVENTYEGYMQLVKDLGLEMPSKWKKHWIPKESTLWYFIDSKGQVGVKSFSNSTFDNELVANFNIFPNKELAEKAVNLSKLERLILLWQYANGCAFEPDWLDDIQCKYFIIYDSRDKNACYDYNFRQKSNNIYFETSEQVKAFIEMYDKEIKELMNIK